MRATARAFRAGVASNPGGNRVGLGHGAQIARRKPRTRRRARSDPPAAASWAFQHQLPKQKPGIPGRPANITRPASSSGPKTEIKSYQALLRRLSSLSTLARVHTNSTINIHDPNVPSPPRTIIHSSEPKFGPQTPSEAKFGPQTPSEAKFGPQTPSEAKFGPESKFTFQTPAEIKFGTQTPPEPRLRGMTPDSSDTCSCSPRNRGGLGKLGIPSAVSSAGSLNVSEGESPLPIGSLERKAPLSPSRAREKKKFPKRDRKFSEPSDQPSGGRIRGMFRVMKGVFSAMNLSKDRLNKNSRKDSNSKLKSSPTRKSASHSLSSPSIRPRIKITPKVVIRSNSNIVNPRGKGATQRHWNHGRTFSMPPTTPTRATHRRPALRSSSYSYGASISTRSYQPNYVHDK
ncbi:hypothetical protein AAMO2058_000555900 [Amorphochlora amoebiformis]